MNEPMVRAVCLAHLTATLFMTGVIWFVQVVHYPLFAGTGRAEFSAYERRHARLTRYVVAPPMLLEGVSAVALFWFRPDGVTAWLPGAGLALLAVVWLSTALVQIPCHEALCGGFDPALHRRLVSTNRVRTAAWSLRAVLALWIVWAVTA